MLLVIVILVAMILMLAGTLVWVDALFHARKVRWNRLSVYLPGAYVLMVTLVLAYTAYYTKPDYLGYDWIPFLLLTGPWTRSMPGICGIIINTVALCVAGMLIGKLRD